MSNDDVRLKLQEVLDEANILFTGNEVETQIDSIAFISLIIRIEEVFAIEFPDELLNFSVMQAQEGLETIISNLVEAEEDKKEDMKGDLHENSEAI